MPKILKIRETTAMQDDCIAIAELARITRRVMEIPPEDLLKIISYEPMALSALKRAKEGVEDKLFEVEAMMNARRIMKTILKGE